MKEIPLLFTADMVRAILHGRKNVTRRLKFRGEQGDRVWVRETWCTQKCWDNLKPADLRPWGHGIVGVPFIHYLADGPKPEWGGKTRVSIHMPRWASRISLVVSSVRQEKLKHITDHGALSEGVTLAKVPFVPLYPASGGNYGERNERPREAYARLWDTINAKPGTTWNDNPQIAVICFDREKSNGTKT